MKNNNIIIRIDDRLVHGQVIVGWVKGMGLNNIVVANDPLLKDKLKMQLMKLAVPFGVNIEFLSIKETVEKFKLGKWKKFKSIILFESPKDAYKFLKEVEGINSINVGGLHFKENRKQLTPNIAVNKEDIEYLIKINELGIKMEGRALPTEDSYDVFKLIEKNGNNTI